METNALNWLDTAYNVGCLDLELPEKFKTHYLDQGGLNEASRRIKTLLDTYSSWGALWIVFGDIQTELRDIPQAVESYEKSLILDPSSRDAYIKLSLSYEQLGDIEKAIGSCLRASEVFPDHKSIHLRLAKLYLQREHLQETAEHLDNARDDGLSALEKQEKRLLEVTLFWRTGEVENLIRSLEHVMTSLTMNTNITIDSAKNLGQLIYEISERFCSRRQWELAEMAFRIATHIAPEELNTDRFTGLLSHVNN
jgi:tetratricopeptide (TPR) repeat protein